MKDESANRKIGSAISIANMLVSLLIGLVYTPLLIRNLGKNEYGVYTLAISLIAYLFILDLGFGNALVRYTSRFRAEGKDDTSIIGMFLLFYTAIAFIAGGIGSLVALNIEDFFSSSFTINETRLLKKVFIILLVNTVIAFPASVFSSIIRSYEKFIFVNATNLLQNILNHVVMITLLITGFKSVSLAMVSLCSTIIITIINIVYCFKKIKVRLRFECLESKVYKEIMIYSLFILVNIMVDQLYANTDKLILGKMCGSVAIGIYSVGVTFQQYFT